MVRTRSICLYVSVLSLCVVHYTLPSFSGSSEKMFAKIKKEVDIPKTFLVTYADNEPFTYSQQNIIKTQQNRSIDVIGAWNKKNLIERFPQYIEQWNYPGLHGRPSCVFFKPVLVNDSMYRSNAGDWTVWVDSSRYFVNGIQESIGEFVRMLDKLGLDSFPGVALCGLTNVDNQCVSAKTFRDLHVDIPRYWFAPHFQNNFLAFKKNQKNLEFVREWTEMMMDMDVACGSSNDDQAIFSILVTKYNLLFLNFCNFEMELNNPDFQMMKNVDFVINKVSSMDTSYVMTQDSFVRQWRKLQWTPSDCQLKETVGYYSHASFHLKS